MSGSQLEQGTEKKLKELEQSEIDITQEDATATPHQLLFPALVDQQQTSSGYDFLYSDMGTPNVNAGNSTVYSPFFLQMFYSEKKGMDSAKMYPRDFSDPKSTGKRVGTYLVPDMGSTDKMAPPLMLPESAAQTNKTMESLMSVVTENNPFFSECLEQLAHVSRCRKLEGECNYPLCFTIKRDMYSIITRFSLVTIRRSVQMTIVFPANCCVLSYSFIVFLVPKRTARSRFAKLRCLGSLSSSATAWRGNCLFTAWRMFLSRG